MKNISQSANRMWLKLDKTFFGLDEDLYLCGIYIPPLNSPHYNNEYQNLESEISKLAGKGKILITGDFNSRVSTNADFVLHDDNNDNLSHLLPDNYKSDYDMTRRSQDKILNSQGRELLDLCATAQLRLLNGRFIGDILGNITCFNTKGCSIVDYAVTSMSLLSSVKYFKVQDPSPFSDHCQLVTYITCNFQMSKLQSQYIKQKFNYKWTKLSKKLLEMELTKSDIYEEIGRFQTNKFEKTSEGINLASNAICNIYTNLSEKCMIKNCFKKVKKKNKAPWTDNEYLELRKTVQKMGKKLKLSPFDQNLKLKFFSL
ncbi:Hypothetical predicted protein [Mytilus galloprovincialis]|uniref:Endonuclease/exonuclease/phosphatase domain-containing protein n=2 Tax=Mytilus galloprovincialis TaxID=29158 RepID=A0A8B6HC31_MYTGA|nr:Hypothetical predicted protein [Mytilus galloprovincialis]